jgi:hypothetical protein
VTPGLSWRSLRGAPVASGHAVGGGSVSGEGGVSLWLATPRSVAHSVRGGGAW